MLLGRGPIREIILGVIRVPKLLMALAVPMEGVPGHERRLLHPDQVRPLHVLSHAGHGGVAFHYALLKI